MWLRPSLRYKKPNVRAATNEFHTTGPSCSNTNKTHYETLGVPRNATHAQIKSAYFDLTKRFHPDSDPSNKSLHNKFVAINQAYHVLSKPSTRSEYDKQISSQSRSPTGDFYENIQRQKPRRYEPPPYGFNQNRMDESFRRKNPYGFGQGEDPFESFYNAERQRERDEFRRRFYGNVPKYQPLNKDKKAIAVIIFLIVFGLLVDISRDKIKRERELEKEARRRWFERQARDNRNEDDD